MIKWGLAGCGDISGKRVAPAIKAQEGSLLAAAFSPFEDELKGFIEKQGISKGYTDFGEMLNNEDIQAVYVATPVFLHYDFAIEALKAGKHVIVEKPMAMTNEQCETMIKTAEDNSVQLGVAYFRRFFPKLSEVKRVISEGVIGEVIQIRILYHSWYNPPAQTSLNWRLVKKLSGGGPLWDMGCHKFDLLTDLIGRPVSVFGKMDTLTHEYEVEDSCSALLEMENGAHCLASFNWNSRVWSDEFEILGTNGKIIMDPCDSDSLVVRMNPRVLKGMGREETKISKPNHSNVHFPLVDDFVKALEKGTEPAVTGKKGIWANRILTAIEESAKSGCKINI